MWVFDAILRKFQTRITFICLSTLPTTHSITNIINVYKRQGRHKSTTKCPLKQSIENPKKTVHYLVPVCYLKKTRKVDVEGI